MNNCDLHNYLIFKLTIACLHLEQEILDKEK